MGKRKREERRAAAGEQPVAPARRAIDPLRVVSLVGVVALLAISYANRQAVEALEGRVGERVGDLEGRVAAVSDKLGGDSEQRRGPDPDKVYSVNTAGAPYKGPPDAPITIVEFSDFEWPFCARVGPTLQRIQEVYGDHVKIVWKHNPLRFHRNARAAHTASLVAFEHGKFWEYHDKLFSDTKDLGFATLRRYASELGLDLERFDKAVADRRLQQIIDDDIAEARRLGATGTPAFFVNGRFLSGAKPFEEFAELIDAELERLGLPLPAAAAGSEAEASAG